MNPTTHLLLARNINRNEEFAPSAPVGRSVTQTSLRHRPHHLSTMRRRFDHLRGYRRSLGNRQNSRAPGLIHPRSTKDPSSPRRVHADRLIPLWIPVQFLSRRSLLPSSLANTPQRRERLGMIHGKQASQILLAG